MIAWHAGQPDVEHVPGLDELAEAVLRSARPTRPGASCATSARCRSWRRSHIAGRRRSCSNSACRTSRSPSGADEHRHGDPGRAVAAARHRRLPDRARPDERQRRAMSANGFTRAGANGRLTLAVPSKGRMSEPALGSAPTPGSPSRRPSARCSSRARTRRSTCCSCGRTTSRSTSRTASSTSASPARTSSSRPARTWTRWPSSASPAARSRPPSRRTRRRGARGPRRPPRRDRLSRRRRERCLARARHRRRSSSASPARSRPRRGSGSRTRSSTSSRPARRRARTACACSAALLDSQAVLDRQRGGAVEREPRAVERLELMLPGVVAARRRRYLMMNAPASALTGSARAAEHGRAVRARPRRAGGDRDPRRGRRRRGLGPAAAAEGRRRLLDPRPAGRAARPVRGASSTRCCRAWPRSSPTCATAATRRSLDWTERLDGERPELRVPAERLEAAQLAAGRARGRARARRRGRALLRAAAAAGRAVEAFPGVTPSGAGCRSASVGVYVPGGRAAYRPRS